MENEFLEWATCERVDKQTLMIFEVTVRKDLGEAKQGSWWAAVAYLEEKQELWFYKDVLDIEPTVKIRGVLLKEDFK